MDSWFVEVCGSAAFSRGPGVAVCGPRFETTDQGNGCVVDGEGMALV